MTNIQCSNNCIYQNNGFCSLDKIETKPLLSTTNDCIYYEKDAFS